MIIRQEIALRDFEFWSGGKDRADNCSAEELDSLEDIFEETATEEGWTETAINDMFWFEFDTLAQYLGYEDEEDFDRKHAPNYVDDDELEDYVSDWFEGFLQCVKENEGVAGLITIFENCFIEDLGNLCENADEEAELEESDEFPNWIGERIYKYLLQQSPSTLMEALFENDNGYNELEDFPTKEQFRDEIMRNIHKS